jgi:hypothetical protein
MDDLFKVAKGLLRAEMSRKDIGYKKLSQLLLAIGVDENEKSLANKVGRGKFSFVFFLQCMQVLGVKSFNIPELVKDNRAPDNIKTSQRQKGDGQ